MMAAPSMNPAAMTVDPAPPPGGMTEAQWTPIREAFELFDQQSRQLQAAYQTLKQDLARSNEALQERNEELTAKIQELRQVSSRLESVIESMTDGLLVIQPDHRIERCNSSAEAMLGQARAAIEQGVFDDVDVLLSPTLPCQTPTLAEAKSMKSTEAYSTDLFTVGPNLAGIPHASIPMGTVHGMPVGALLSTQHFGDDSLLSFIEYLEELL